MRRFSTYFQQFTHFQRNARLYLLSNALSGMTTGIFLVLYNLYLTSLGYNADFVGATLFAVTIGASVTIFPAGFCVDRWSGKWIGGEAGRTYAALVTLAACGPFWPSVISNSTGSPSCRLL